MRLDIPRDDPEFTTHRVRESRTPAGLPSDLKPIRIPESPLTKRIEALQQRARENHAHYISQPRRDRSVARHQEPVERRRQKEYRPRRTREGIALNIRGIRLRSEEQKLIAETARFRVLAVKDIVQTIYGGDDRAAMTDLRFLRDREVIRIDSVAARNDGRWLPPQRIEVITLTKQGQLLAQETGKFAPDQKLYHGLVKPREAEHDTQIYRAYLKEAERIGQAGGKNLRVELDFELKQKIHKAIYAARKSEPERDIGQIKQEVAQRFELPYIDDKIEIPDARIHYELDEGSKAAFSDVEVVTAAYRPRHLRVKEQSGFHVYASSADRASISARIEDERHGLDWVLDL